MRDKNSGGLVNIGPEKLSKDCILKDSDFLIKDTITCRIIDLIPHEILILNTNRQIIYANKKALEVYHKASLQDVLGLFPGEFLHCVNAQKNVCGNSGLCELCGMFRALKELDYQHDSQISCNFTSGSDTFFEAFDLDVTVSLVDFFPRKTFIFFTISDISSEKRRKALERIFFHDVLNTAGALKNSLDIILNYRMEDIPPELFEILPLSAERLINEIQAQRDLILAENNELHIHSHHFSINDFIASSVKQSTYNKYNKIRIKYIPAETDFAVYADPIILNRIIANMIKNALEAGEPHDEVVVGIKKDTDVCVYVHNKQIIPAAEQSFIFTRSFSTKGGNRGLGTYSMKLLGERYLKAKVKFKSNLQEGTTFCICLPLQEEK